MMNESDNFMTMNGTRKRRIEIYRETHEITIIRTNRDTQTLFCERCRKSVSTFSIEQIAALLDADLNEICRLIGADVFHLVNTEKGVALVCAGSTEVQGNQKFIRS